MIRAKNNYVNQAAELYCELVPGRSTCIMNFPCSLVYYQASYYLTCYIASILCNNEGDILYFAYFRKK